MPELRDVPSPLRPSPDPPVATGAPTLAGSAHPPRSLFRNGHALVASSATTSVLGVAFWVLAARNYSARDIGLNSAAISSMMFVAGVSQLNLTSALVRFIPLTRLRTRRMVRSAYIVSVAVAAVAGSAFVLVLRHVSDQSQALTSEPLFALWFVVSCMAWCVFALQDAALTGLRKALWVPVENAWFSIVKIVLLIIFVRVSPHYGLFFSWTVAVVVSVVPTNLLIFWRLLPAHERTGAKDVAIPIRQLSRYLVGDYVGALCWLVCTALLPVIVIQEVGPVANADLALAWSIAFALYLVAANMGMSLVVESATDEQRLGVYSYRVLMHVLVLVVPAAAGLVVAAPLVLGIFGHTYVQGGTTVLRLLALSGVPNAVNAVYVSVARVQRRTWAVVAVLGSMCTILVGLSIPLLRRYGIDGVGWAWLISQTAVACVVLATGLRRVWKPVNSDRGVRVARSIRPSQSEQTPTATEAATEAVKQALVRTGVASVAGRALGSLRRQHRASIRLLPQILASLPADTDPGSDPSSWRLTRVVHTVTDVSVLMVGPGGRSTSAVVKVPRTDLGAGSLRAHAHATGILADDPRLASLSPLLPAILAAGDVDGRPFLVERAMPGRQASDHLGDPAQREAVLGAATDAIAELHRTSSLTIVDEAMIERWLLGPLDTIRKVDGGRLLHRGLAIDALAHELRSDLGGATCQIGWAHGDFAPANILMHPDGARVSAILDWERARPDDLPILDVVHLLLCARAAKQRAELGDVVRQLCREPRWDPLEQYVIDAAELVTGDSFRLRTLVLLCWCRHVASNLQKADRFAGHRYWLRHNIDDVLSDVAR